ncbi:MAG: hypothetical protein JRJ06_01115 [Deltaproteobacteria bacterium]|nr:hypothetical protein [Deltaproteobacteria bacterium]
MEFLKKVVIVAVIVAIGYALLGYHYIIIGKSVKMLKKSTLTLQYTIFNTKGKEMSRILSIEPLWEDGIGDLLVEQGIISEEQLELYKEKMEEEEYSDN